MIAGNYYVSMYKGNDLNQIPPRVHLWLGNMTRIDLGNYNLHIFKTLGHTSGLHFDHRDYAWFTLLG